MFAADELNWTELNSGDAFQWSYSQPPNSTDLHQVDPVRPTRRGRRHEVDWLQGCSARTAVRELQFISVRLLWTQLYTIVHYRNAVVCHLHVEMTATVADQSDRGTQSKQVPVSSVCLPMSNAYGALQMNIQTKSNVQIKQVCVQLPIYADNVALPAFASLCSSNRSMSPARPHAGTDRRTDTRTDTVPSHRPCSAHYACSANKLQYRYLHYATNTCEYNTVRFNAM